MPILRVLASAILLLCSAAAHAQTTASGNLIQEQKPKATATEPWRIVPQGEQPAASENLFNLRDQKSPAWTLNSESPMAMVFPPMKVPESAVLQQQGDDICYTMRSYVVARDDNDSDATHLAHYSTCQKASRYRLKQAEVRADQ